MNFFENCVNQGVLRVVFGIYMDWRWVAECRSAGLNRDGLSPTNYPHGCMQYRASAGEHWEVGVIGDGPTLIAATQGTIAAQVTLADGDDSIAEC